MDRAAVLTAVAAVPLVLGACSLPGSDDGPDAPRAGIGDVVPVTFGGDVEGHHSYVVVPGRRYDLLVTSQREETDASSAADAGVDVRPEDGAEVVGITWQLAAAEGDWFAAVAEDDPEVPVSLVVDGEHYPVGDLLQDGPGAWVVVPEGSRTVGVEVGYAGEVQRIDDARSTLADHPVGARPGLYLSPPRLGPGETTSGLLGGRRGAAYFTGGDARTTALSPVPYVTGLGWAPAGKAWLLVDVTVDGALAGHDAGDDYVEYVVDGGEVDVRFDDERPTELLPLGAPRAETDLVGSEPLATGLEDEWRARVVFTVDDDVRGGDLVVRRPYTVLPEEPDEAARLGTPADLDRTLRLRRTLSF